MTPEPTPAPLEIEPEDAKLLTLARSARVRNQASEGAAVRDETGRTYVATSVELPSLRLTALQAAVVVAASSGASGLEAAAVVSGDEPAAVLRERDRAAVSDLATGVPVYLAGSDGVVHGVVRVG